MNFIVNATRDHDIEFEGLFSEVQYAENYIKQEIEDSPYAAERYSIWRVFKNSPWKGQKLVSAKSADEWAKFFDAIPFHDRYQPFNDDCPPEEADPVDCEEVY